MHKILLVDDDIELCDLLQDYLTQENYQVDVVNDGESAASMVSAGQYDLMVLDVMLPKKNGFDVLREINFQKKTPVLMLTARGDEVDRILGLEMGADDYLSKPCNPRELTARIRSIIRRAEALPPNFTARQEPAAITLGDVTVHPGKRQVLVNEQEVELTATEYHILILLLENAGELVTREQISEQCLGRKLMAFDRSIDMHISHLRKKMGEPVPSGERIKTIRGVGYQYVAI